MVRRKRTGEPEWVRWSDERLLDLRLCDLGLRIAGTRIEARLERLYEELERREILLQPHAWLSSEWFSPDGVPGIAIPFYLAHPRLARLENRMVYEVEGGTERACMQLLRHEAGHAVATAYRLQRRRSWREVFGPASQPYPKFYRPEPLSRDYVLHLDWWYAQSHPSEDFAETFAVWLKPRSRWRRQYAGWPALAKLEYVDRLMADVAGEAPPVRSRQQVDPLHRMRSTLRGHYRRKQRRYGAAVPDFYDRDLRHLFRDGTGGRGKEAASTFLRRIRPRVRDAIAEWTGQHPYMIDKVMRDMIDRCRELKLRRHRPEREARMRAMLLVTVHTMNFVHTGHQRITV